MITGFFDNPFIFLAIYVILIVLGFLYAGYPNRKYKRKYKKNKK